jgi:hypothetical protein
VELHGTLVESLFDEEEALLNLHMTVIQVPVTLATRQPIDMQGRAAWGPPALVTTLLPLLSDGFDFSPPHVVIVCGRRTRSY